MEKRSVEHKTTNRRISRLCISSRSMNVKPDWLLGMWWLRRKQTKELEQRHFSMPPFFRGKFLHQTRCICKKWFAGIYAKHGHYFSTLKNHRGLYKIGRDFFENTENDQGKWQYFQQREKGHGRDELREIWTTMQLRV
jgi:hypothetical protein